MKNTVTVSAEFCFKGQKLSPSMVIDLDAFILNRGSYESLYPMLARSNNIDLYSYEYEMMQAEDLVFADADGLAVDFLDEGKFDLAAFGRAVHEQRIAEAISGIARDVLSIDDLSSQPELRAALFEAFNLGRKS